MKLGVLQPMSLTKIHVLGQEAEHDKFIDPFGHVIPGNQFPAMTTSDTLIWRDAGLRGDYGDFG